MPQRNPDGSRGDESSAVNARQRSAGVALRANLFGFAVAEFDFSRPFQRAERGWIFGFNLMPGW